MSTTDRANWDLKHARSELGPPARRLIEWRGSLPSTGRALDLACGLGANALWIARNLGMTVDALDISLVALDRLRRARDLERIENLNPVVCDLDAPPFAMACARYDLVVVTSFLDRALFSTIEALLAPGGALYFETFHEGHSKEHPAFARKWTLARGELARSFPRLVVERLEEDSTRAALLARCGTRIV